MCGIVSIIGKDATESSVTGALSVLTHRGPDDHGTMVFPGAVLGQTRLAIIDLSPSGHQPMMDNKKNVAITFNGEIYNYKELRTELEVLGHSFSTQSDTEVILKAYAQYGVECPKYLDGMFAFCIWDAEKSQLLMAKDRFGKKPLYYAHTPTGSLVVGSEIKALLASGVKGEIDPGAIDAYLSLMFVPPWRTIYKNVHTILGGHSAVYKDGKLTVSKYWELEYKPISISYDEARTEVKRLFNESVRKRMIADVEIGSFLSGGVDSTLVTAYAQKFATHPIKTFSLGYGQEINELPFAEEASKKIGTDHHTLQANSELTGELEKSLAYFDEPHGDTASFPQHILSRETAKQVKVALSGEGGDELFLGYGYFFSYFHTNKLSRLRNMLFSNQYKDFIRNSTVFPTALRKSLFKGNIEIAREPIDGLVASCKGTAMQKMDLYEITTHMQGLLLTKVDRMSMMHGLEVRCPFLDYKLAEFVFNLPEEYKTDRNTGKIILKDILREIMPDSFVDRKKQGFGAPVRKWLSEEKMRAYVEKKFSDDAEVYTYLKKEAVQSFVQGVYTKGHPKGYYQLWVLLCLEIWLEKHVSLH